MNDPRSKTGYKGRSYYLMLLAFVGTLIAALASGLYVCVSAYQKAREQSTQALDIAMSAYDLYLQEVKTSPSEEAMWALLNEGGAVDAVLAAQKVDP